LIAVKTLRPSLAGDGIPRSAARSLPFQSHRAPV